MSNLPYQTPLLGRGLFQRLLPFAISCFLAVWLIDEKSGIITDFDAMMYPICIAFLLSIYALTFVKRINDSFLHLLTYTMLASYMIASSISHHMAPRGVFLDSAQWLGLNYVIAYLFLELKPAIVMTIGAFLATIVGHFVVLQHHYSLGDTLGVVLNIAVAHIVYIVLLWAIVKLRSSRDQAKQQAVQLESYAYIDPLTRILNRRGLEKVSQELEEDLLTGQGHYALLLLDIDHFKQINDTYGHLKGDDVLTSIASVLSRKIHAKDIIGRWGGEEFVIFTMKEGRDDILAYANLLREAIENVSLADLKVTVSIGVAHSNDGNSLQEAFQLADKNLYAAKEKGRNTVIYGATTTPQTQQETSILSPS